ncbi:MAG: threonylcarbamoyl-AMP synthase [Myxococcales bacterium]|nr:threonylcarbamoyl-AMP synthase [Myxococcales bacterium]
MRDASDGGWVVEAVAVLRRGGIVALPTESSYGLAASALDPAALARLAIVKGRPEGKPPPLLVDGEGMLGRLVTEIPEVAQALIARHWPGPLTLVLPARPGLPAEITLAGFVAARASPHPIAFALVRAFGSPITATSANRSGEPAALTPAGAALPGVDLVLGCGPAVGGPPSTVARVHPDGRIEILRQGPIAP